MEARDESHELPPISGNSVCIVQFTHPQYHTVRGYTQHFSPFALTGAFSMYENTDTSKQARNMRELRTHPPFDYKKAGS